jgi:hypothetical protein
MGKKSNEKRKRREVEDELKKPVKKIKKEKKQKKDKKEKIGKIKLSKQKIFGGIFALIMLCILVAVGYLLFQRALRPEPLAKMLPEEKTIILAELNSNFSHHQLTKTFELLGQNESYKKERLIQFIENKFLINYELDIEPWIGRQVGIAFMKSEDESIEKVYFAEIFSEKNAIEYISEKASIEEYEENKIYIKNDGKNSTIIKDYIVFAENSEVLKYLIDFNNSDNANLYESRAYRRIDDNMPINKLVFLYVNFELISNEVISEIPIMKNLGVNLEDLSPLIKLFESEGMSIVAMDDKFAVQGFLSMSKNDIEDSKYIGFKEKYSAELTNYISEDAIAFWGGENFEYQTKRLLEALSRGEGDMISLFEKTLNNYTHKYFGPEISFSSDILPLFAHEFGVSIEEVNGKTTYKIILELYNPTEDSVKLHEIANNFAEIGMVFEPQVVETTLEDGTVAKEIVAVSEEIIKTESEYKNYTIYEMQIGLNDWSISYAVVDEMAVISTATDGIKSLIDIKENPKNSLKNSQTFSKLISPVLKNSDEISYFNMEKVMPLMFESQELPIFIELISKISSGKSYFEDGITSINYLLLR